MSDYTPSFAFESELNAPVAGIDEVGCGSWAGPVVAAAVHLTADFPQDLLHMLNDSKKLSGKKRTYIFAGLCHEYNKTASIGVGEVSAAEIDCCNIANATKKAMFLAVQDMRIRPESLLIDGNRTPNLGVHTQMVIKGDQRSYSIAAASIVAKVVRDAIMHRLHQQYPCYRWDSNVGYGTKDHQNALACEGVTPFHRQTYAPVHKICLTQSISVSSSEKTFYDSVYKKSILQVNKIICS